MIPKVIHYCWFGNNEKSKKIKHCIESWHKICPSYEIIEWNETNFNVDQHKYLKWCHENKKWAYLSDFARLLIIKEKGGIYFDTDVELVRKLDDFLDYGAFYGFENNENIATGLGFGAEADHSTVNAMINEYLNLVPDQEGNYALVTCPALNTRALKPFGLRLNGQMQNLGDTIILPAEYMNPYDDPTGRLNVTESTISIHWYAKSWMSNKSIRRSRITRPFHRVFGLHCFDFLKKE